MNKRMDVGFTENALTVLNSRYLRRDVSGQVVEPPEELFKRVAISIASQETSGRSKWTDKFFEMMISRRFIPNSPTLMNAGRKQGQLSACFVLPIEDSLDSIFDSLKYAAMIHQSGGGTGFSFSRIRPKGSRVGSNHGIASGPVSYIRIFDVATDTIKQGGTRRGANMAVLRVDHPDIQEFIDAKRDQKSISNFNVSVGITSAFMQALQKNQTYLLKDPSNAKSGAKLSARFIFDRIIQSAWECGDPGLVFLDRINLFNPTPQVGEMESTNPCGEQPLLPFESCNLGSLNLGEYFIQGRFQWDLFESDIRNSVRFLDNVIDLNSYPVPECEKITLKNRKIGLGVMGFADLLLLEGVRYATSDAVRRGEEIMSFLDRVAKEASAELAKKRGPFPNWKKSMWNKLGYSPLRNATVSTVAPTGTISIIAGASSGIEPIFSASFTRNVLDGKQLTEVHPAVRKLLSSRNLSLESMSPEDFRRELGFAWCPSQDVPVEYHVKVQAAFQRHSDSAVSKTINLPEAATVSDVEAAYLLAYQSGCKGITVYRDRSKPTQVLEHGVKFRPLSKDDCSTC